MDFPFTLAPGQTITVNSRQAYLYYEAGNAGGLDASVKVSADIGDEIVLKPGQGFRYAGPFNRLYLSNAKGQATIVGHIILEAGEFFDNRVTGTVDVVDGARTRTLGGLAFLSYGGAPAVVGQYPIVQLFNPAGSGRNLFVEAFAAQTSAAGALGMALRSTLIEVTSGMSGFTGGTSKKVGAAVSVSRMSQGNSPTFPTSYTLMNLDKSKREFVFKEPIMCPPGSGVFVFDVKDGEDMGASFEYFEEPL